MPDSPSTFQSSFVFHLAVLKKALHSESCGRLIWHPVFSRVHPRTEHLHFYINIFELLFQLLNFNSKLPFCVRACGLRDAAALEQSDAQHLIEAGAARARGGDGRRARMDILCSKASRV